MPEQLIVVVCTPNHEFTQHPGQPPSTYTAYAADVAAGETADDVLSRIAASLPIGSRVMAFDPATALADAELRPVLQPIA